MDTSIFFNNPNQKLHLPDLKSVRSWIVLTAKLEGFRVGELGFVFCDDEYLRTINVEFLDHDTYTDIITFDYSTEEFIAGEIYISEDRVIENAKLYLQDVKKETHRIIIHGVLHLLGYKDKSQEEKAQMNSKENYYLSLLPELG